MSLLPGTCAKSRLPRPAQPAQPAHPGSSGLHLGSIQAHLVSLQAQAQATNDTRSPGVGNKL